MLQEIKEAVEYISKHFTEKPKVGIILGTGLGALVSEVEILETLSYSNIPNFPISTVESHAGKLILGKINGTVVVIMQGRFHYYEGYNMKQITFPVRVMKYLGIEHLFISNAAGGLKSAHEKGDIMIINDHINLQLENPLRGTNYTALGPRFPDMSEPYSLDLINKAKEIANNNNISFHEGVYASVPGPNLETRAEYKYLSIIGADAVGMSTVPEVIVGVHMGLKIFAITAITDLCTPEKIEKVSLEDILHAASIAEPKMTFIIKELVGKI